MYRNLQFALHADDLSVKFCLRFIRTGKKQKKRKKRKRGIWVLQCNLNCVSSVPELKSSWMSDSELRTIVKIPNYLAEAMADAVSSKGSLDLAMLPTSSLAAADHATPSCPVLVFINSRSGGLLGPNLFIHLSELISPLQVSNFSFTLKTWIRSCNNFLLSRNPWHSSALCNPTL